MPGYAPERFEMQPNQTRFEPPAEPRRVLMVEDSAGHAQLVRSSLAECAPPQFEIDHVVRLDDALRSVGRQRYDAMLLDLSLPDGEGLTTLGTASSLAGQLPVLVLTGSDDDGMALSALRAGAQEYLVKGRVDYRTLPATILRAIERHGNTRRAIARARQHGPAPELVPLRDPLTGLISEALLWDRLEHAIARVSRCREPLAVAVLRYDALPETRARFGPELADALLYKGAATLHEGLRKGDTLARYGPDGFALVFEQPIGHALLDRLVVRLLEAQALIQLSRADVELSRVIPGVGITRYPSDGVTPAALLGRADAAWHRAVSAGGGLRFYERGVAH